MTAFYNEHDPKAAAWLRELINQGHIAPGVVDERSIEDITPDELAGFTQCHFFAGIGVWSYALRRAGWPDDRPVWTGSCPCQPFSAAGKGGGFDDERHLWPAWHWLIQQCRPGVVFGEQVASKDGLAWLDLVQADMEGTGYAIGAIDLCAAGVGAPHIRQRLYFVADADDARSQGRGVLLERAAQQPARARGMADRMADTQSIGRLGRADDRDAGRRERASGLEGEAGGVGFSDSAGWESGRTSAEATGHGRSALATGDAVGLADATGGGCGEQRDAPQQGRSGHVDGGQQDMRPGPTNGHWRNADWLHCTDGKWRPVESGTFPLVDGIAERMVRGRNSGLSINTESTAEARVARLRGYGNAIVAPLATEFVRSFMETRA